MECQGGIICFKSLFKIVAEDLQKHFFFLRKKGMCERSAKNSLLEEMICTKCLEKIRHDILLMVIQAEESYKMSCLIFSEKNNYF